MSEEQKKATWDRQQAELWDRIFQAIGDVVDVAENMQDSTGVIHLKEQLIKTSMGVGAELVRANASYSSRQFNKYINEARLKAIESDYWLRLIYVLQQRKEIQQDLSNVISQYNTIINLLNKFIKHTKDEPDVISKHTKGPKVNL